MQRDKVYKKRLYGPEMLRAKTQGEFKKSMTTILSRCMQPACCQLFRNIFKLITRSHKCHVYQSILDRKTYVSHMVKSQKWSLLKHPLQYKSQKYNYMLFALINCILLASTYRWKTTEVNQPNLNPCFRSTTVMVEQQFKENLDKQVTLLTNSIIIMLW